MISSIGFIPNTQEIKELKEFQMDKEIQHKVEYLGIPIIPKADNEDEQDFPEIKSTDNILFCTPNTEEISNVAFYGYDDTEVFFHHDLFVFSTILDSCFVKDSFVAVATFEPFVFIYDALVEFPILPQILLEGHESAVTGIKNKEGRLISCSDDQHIIEWDLNTLQLKNKTDVKISIEKFDFEGSSMVFGSQTYLSINNQQISLENDVEQIKCKENNVFVTDCDGNMMIYDIRAPAKAMLSKKIHEDSVLDLCLVKDWIVTCSVDNHVKLWKLEGDLICKNDMEQDSTVYALGFNEFGSEDEVFAGNDDDFVYPIKLEQFTDAE